MSTLHLDSQGIRGLSLGGDTVVSLEPGAERIFAPQGGGGVLSGKYWDGRQFSLIKHICTLPACRLLIQLAVRSDLSYDISSKLPSRIPFALLHHFDPITVSQHSCLTQANASRLNAKPVPSQ